MGRSSRDLTMQKPQNSSPQMNNTPDRYSIANSPLLNSAHQHRKHPRRRSYSENPSSRIATLSSSFTTILPLLSPLSPFSFDVCVCRGPSFVSVLSLSLSLSLSHTHTHTHTLH